MTAPVWSSQGMRTGPPVSSTTAVRGLALRDALNQRVLPVRQAQIRRIGRLGHVLVGEHDDRVGASRRLRRARRRFGRRRSRRGRAEIAVRIASSGDDGSKIIARSFPSGSFKATPPRGMTCDEPPPDGTPRVGMRADDQDPARLRRERQQALVAQEHRAFLLDGERRRVA